MQTTSSRTSAIRPGWPVSLCRSPPITTTTFLSPTVIRPSTANSCPGTLWTPPPSRRSVNDKFFHFLSLSIRPKKTSQQWHFTKLTLNQRSKTRRLNSNVFWSYQVKLQRRMAHWVEPFCLRSARSLRCWWRKKPTPTRDRGPMSCTASPPPTDAHWAWTAPPRRRTHRGTLGTLRRGRGWLRPLDFTSDTGKDWELSDTAQIRKWHQMLIAEVLTLAYPALNNWTVNNDSKPKGD